MKEGGRNSKQNPGPASLTSLLISAQIPTGSCAVLESPFSAAHQKLLTRTEATVIQPQLQTGSAVPKPLFCRRGALENLAQTLGTWLPRPLCCVPAAEGGSLHRAGQGARSTPLLYVAVGCSVKKRAFFTRKGTEFQQLRQRQTSAFWQLLSGGGMDIRARVN